MEENDCWYWSILEIQLPHRLYSVTPGLYTYTWYTSLCYTWCGPDSSEKRWSPSRCRIASTIVSRFCFPAPVTDHLSNILTQRYSYDDCTMYNYKNIVIQCYSYDCTHWCCRTSESQCIAGSLQSQGPWAKRLWKFGIGKKNIFIKANFCGRFFNMHVIAREDLCICICICVFVFEFANLHICNLNRLWLLMRKLWYPLNLRRRSSLKTKTNDDNDDFAKDGNW